MYNKAARGVLSVPPQFDLGKDTTMIVSKSSWHYRLYFWLKSEWADDEADFNHNPDLCSYVSTIVGIGLLTGFLGMTLVPIFWLCKQFGKVANFCFANSKRGLVSLVTLFAAGLTLFLYLVAMDNQTTMVYEALVVGKIIGVMLLVVAAVLSLAFIVVLIGSGFRRARTKATPVTQLAVTWTRDKWNGTFCRILTFVD